MNYSEGVWNGDGLMEEPPGWRPISGAYLKLFLRGGGLLLSTKSKRENVLINVSLRFSAKTFLRIIISHELLTSLRCDMIKVTIFTLALHDRSWYITIYHWVQLLQRYPKELVGSKIMIDRDLSRYCRNSHFGNLQIFQSIFYHIMIYHDVKSW